MTGGELPGGNIRASDQERESVASELRLHCIAGRISTEELEARLSRAISAQTIHELAELVVDLPRSPAPAPSPRPVRVGLPGVAAFTHRVVVPASARGSALDTLTATLNRYGYALEQRTGSQLTFARTRPAGAAVAAAILIFPLGLLALLAKTTDRIILSVEQDGEGAVTVAIAGRASRRVRKALVTCLLRHLDG